MSSFVCFSICENYCTLSAVEAMRWAVGEGLISGTAAGLLAPQGNATRAQVATILMRFIEGNLS